MRVTNSMMQNQVVFNMQRSLSRFMRLQTEMSSGRRINAPSDDPTGTLQALSYRSELSKFEQYQKNVNKGISRMGMYDSILADMKNLMTDAKVEAGMGADDTYDANAREAAANQIRDIFEGILKLANTEFNGSKMFAGFNTRTTPFEKAAYGVVYLGDNGKIDFEVETSFRTNVNFTGEEVLMNPTRILGEESDLNVGILDSTLVADLNMGNGIDMTAGSFTITDRNLGITVTVDLNAAPPVTTVAELLARVNADLAANVPPISNMTAVISGSGNAIAFDTTEDGLISDATSLQNLRSGNGIDLDPASLNLSDGAGISINVDLSGASTIGDIRTLFNNAMIASGDPQLVNVSMSINAAGTGLQIDDANGVPIGLTVSDTSASGRVTEDLGLVGAMGAQMVGEDLQPIVSFEIDEAGGTTASDLGIKNSFKSDFDGNDLDPVITGSSLLTDFNNGLGFDRGEIHLMQGDINLRLDLSDIAIVTVQDLLDRINNSGLDITASINSSGRGIQIVNNDMTRTFAIEESGSTRSARQMGLFGGGDVMSTLMVLEDSLRSNDREGVSILLEHLEEGLQRLLQIRGRVGAKAIALENTSTRLLDQHFVFTSLLSEVEDADFTKLVTDLATQEASYQAALMAAAKIIQPSLLNFLR